MWNCCQCSELLLFLWSLGNLGPELGETGRSWSLAERHWAWWCSCGRRQVPPASRRSSSTPAGTRPHVRAPIATTRYTHYPPTRLWLGYVGPNVVTLPSIWLHYNKEWTLKTWCYDGIELHAQDIDHKFHVDTFGNTSASFKYKKKIFTLTCY